MQNGTQKEKEMLRCKKNKWVREVIENQIVEQSKKLEREWVVRKKKENQTERDKEKERLQWRNQRNKNKTKWGRSGNHENERK